jgi:hypothetical protein
MLFVEKRIHSMPRSLLSFETQAVEQVKRGLTIAYEDNQKVSLHAWGRSPKFLKNLLFFITFYRCRKAEIR